ncbi:MAG TPA: metal-dependent phosphohydrolase [Treponema sp.]|jgi:HD-GYP domain-containing protein (c-di-GMP phosphodiesterase class II)|nr:metal-dependent phosphohydrolase [Treponema sp.]HBB41900.1 metal-dependent phosphohydrolase [Treponema sp.]HCA20406.1 metal-dependent phosphohydrolase [Treponema sp.]
METYKVSDLKADNVYPADIMLDKTFIICPANCPLPQETIRALLEWSFTAVISEGKTSVTVPVSKEEVEQKKVEISAKTEEVTALVVEEQKKDEEAKESVYPQIQEALRLAEEKKSSITNDKDRMAMVQDVYNAYCEYINRVFTRYATHKEFNKGEIFGTVRELCNFIKANGRYILRVTPAIEDRNKNFQVFHSMRSTVLSITIGLQLKMEFPKLVELGVASLLHEIGMLRISPQLYMNNKPLTVAEKNQILTHPIISYNILKEAGFSLPILLGVLDHHERENGTGYPRHMQGPKISYYAKIIAAACSFEAITAPRHFKEARTTYEAMTEMLKNENHQYDATVLKALLYSLSLYPIGAYVYLSNGKIAQVVDVNPSDPRNPVIQVWGEKTDDGNPKVMQTNDTLKISRVMSRREADDVIEALAKQASAK